tara:strand:- start:224 stop:1075 length:852 start_codon:yes stop_codon:yes gene_type:complete
MDIDGELVWGKKLARPSKKHDYCSLHDVADLSGKAYVAVGRCGEKDSTMLAGALNYTWIVRFDEKGQLEWSKMQEYASVRHYAMGVVVRSGIALVVGQHKSDTSPTLAGRMMIFSEVGEEIKSSLSTKVEVWTDIAGDPDIGFWLFGNEKVGQNYSPYFVHTDEWFGSGNNSDTCCSVTLNSCDDGSPCTRSVCGSGTCKNTSLQAGAICDDGQLCKTLGTCLTGSCSGTKQAVCDDGNACTADACGAAGCSYTSKSDGTVCTANGSTGSCKLGVCMVAGGTP